MRACWALGLASAALALHGQSACSQDLALRADTILTMTGEPVRNGTLVVQDGKVAAVGAGVSVPPGVTVIDLPGRTIMPGLIDANAWEGLRGQQTEESREVSPSFHVSRSLDPDSPQLRQLAQRGTTTVCVTPGHRAVIGGLCAVMKTAGASRAAMMLKDEAALQAVIGSQPNWDNRIPWGQRPGSFYYRRPTTRMGGVWLLREAFFALGEGARPPSPADDRVLRAVAAGQLPLRLNARRRIDIETAYRIADELSLRNLILEEAFEAYQVADEIARRKTPVILSNLYYQGGDQPRTPELSLNNAGILAAVGVKLAFGSALSDGRPDLLTCALMAHRYGLPRDVCLNALTINAAEILGVADRVGALDPGKDADFLALSGDPLSVTTRIDQVYVGGRQVYRQP